MANIHRYYLEHLANQTGYRATWEPNKPLFVGAIVKLEKGVTSLHSSLEKEGIKMDTKADTSEGSEDYSSNESVQISVKLSGQAPVLGSTLSQLDAGFSIDFSSDKAVVFQAEKTITHQISNLGEIEAEILKRVKEGSWQKDWCLVSEVVEATSATIIISQSSNSKLDLKATGNVGAKNLKLTDASLGLSVASQKGSILKIIAANGITPLYRLRGFKKSWPFGKPGFEVKDSEEALDEIAFDPAELEDFDLQEKFIVLTKEGPSFEEFGTRGGFSSKEFSGSKFSKNKSEFDAHFVNAEEIKDFGLENETVIGVAPFMTMKLITPKEIVSAENLNLTSPVWGIEAVGAHNCPYDGSGITVAVLDTGIDKDHEAFRGVEIVEMDFSGEGNGDKNGHGTHCAGTILGRDVNGVRIGIARGVTKLLVGKVFDSRGGGSSGSIVEAIDWAVKNGANIISMSLGIDYPGYQQRLESRGYPSTVATSLALEGYRMNIQLFQTLIASINAKGIGGLAQPVIIVAAAGNESERDINLNYKIAVSPPAVSEGIISVGAIGKNGTGYKVATFSNTGPILSAPGVNIISAKAGGGLISMNGTSMATPHVAGVATLWAQKMKNEGFFNSAAIIAKLRANCVANDIASDRIDFGEGCVQAPKN